MVRDMMSVSFNH